MRPFSRCVSVMTVVFLAGSVCWALPLEQFNAAAPTTVSFQQGDANSYSGTVDTFIGAPSTGHQGSNSGARQDLHQGGTSWHTLMRFDNIIGSGLNQIPAFTPNPNPQPGDVIAVQINSATLGLESRSTSSQTHDIYQLTVPFTSASSWNSLGSGITIGSDTLASPTFSGTVSQTNNSFVNFDITSAVQNWVNGAANEGLYFDTSTGGGSLFDSAENAFPSSPLLTVEFEVFTVPFPIPEPGSIFLWGLIGSSALGYTYWRRRKSR